MSMILEIAALVIVTFSAWRVLRRTRPDLPVGRVAAVVLGVYAAFLGGAHGVFELQQSGGAPDGIMINAIGDPCEPADEWHACFPAMTVIPDIHAAGVLVLLTAASIFVWSVFFVQRPRGGPVLVALAVIFLLVGGGFFPPFYAIIGGIARWRVKSA